MKSCIFWDIRPWSTLKINRRFGGMILRVEDYTRQESSVKQVASRAPKCRLTSNRLHDAICQKAELFITTAAKTSDPAVFLYGKAAHGYDRRFEKLFSLCLLLASRRFILHPRWWKRHVPPKRRLTFSEPRGAICQKTELYIPYAMRTSDHTPLQVSTYIGRLQVVQYRGR
jgi:hypothetical protein